MKPGKINSYKAFSDIEINNKKYDSLVMVTFLR